jgi:hypothetical protein
LLFDSLKRRGGTQQKSTRTFLHHIKVALGSEAEFETQIEVALRPGYCSKDDVLEILARSRGYRQDAPCTVSLSEASPPFEEAAALSASCVVLAAGWWCVSAAMLQWF